MIPLALDVTLVLLGPVILVISLFLRVLLVLMVPRDLEFPLVLVVSHGLVVTSRLVFNSLCLPIQCTYPVQFIVPATPSKQNNNKADKNAKTEEKQV